MPVVKMPKSPGMSASPAFYVPGDLGRLQGSSIVYSIDARDGLFGMKHSI
jgi:hypothetical protein